MIRRYFLFAFLFAATYSNSNSDSLDIEKFVENASIRYETEFNVPASLELWNRMLDNLILVGKLWEIYKFSPRYKITSKGSGVHIIDPTGIEGDMFEIHSDIYNRKFIATGRMKNWNIPISLKGRTLFLIHHTVDQNGVYAILKIYIEEGDTLFTQLLLKAVSPILRYYINKRVTRNISDLTKIIDDIVKKPETIRPLVKNTCLAEFDQLLKTGSDAK